MHLYKTLTLVIAVLYFHVNTFAWGSIGHKITATIAEQHMNARTKDSVAYFLNGTTMEDASKWMDELRSNHEFDYLKPLHYLNIEKGETFDPTSQGNIISELNKVIAELKDRKHHTKEETETNLKILIHLVGDLHQPLHVGYGSDKGGNTIHLTFLGESSNLHKVWDSEIIKAKHIYPKDCTKLLGRYSKDEIARLEQVNIIEWMNQGRALLPEVYAFNNDTIDQAYLDKTAPIVEKQLLLAGLRMATLLQEIFIK